jgi:hypothetical protein
MFEPKAEPQTQGKDKIESTTTPDDGSDGASERV